MLSPKSSRYPPRSEPSPPPPLPQLAKPFLDVPTATALYSDSSTPSSPTYQPKIRPSTSAARLIEPFARAFPRPPDGTASPTIRPGSVRSVTLERQDDDDRSIRSRKASIGRASPMPPIPTPDNTFDNNSAPHSRYNQRLHAEMLEAAEGDDQVGALTSPSDSLGVIGSFDKRLNRSVMSLGAKVKAQSVLGADPQPRMASLYLVSGLGKDPAQWAFSDKDAITGVQPLEDSLGVWWRPDMLGNTFSGEKNDESSGTRNGKGPRSSNSSSRRDIQSKTVPGAGPEGASRLVARTMKFAHPKDVEVINSTLAPPTTCHTFTFNVSRQSAIGALANGQATRTANPYAAEPPAAGATDELRGTTHSSDLVFYGVTLTVWSHADKARAAKLKEFKMRTKQNRLRNDSTFSESLAKDSKAARRRKGPINGIRRGPPTDYTTSDLGVSDSDIETTFTSLVDGDYSVSDLASAYASDSDVFWLPYALTLVSRYPIYDVMQDYLRLSWARYAKDARAHMRQMFALLNHDAPRPGEQLRLPIGMTIDDEVVIEASMPGALDYEQGTVKVDFQLWPLFQALDLDHILTCVEVALSNSGRIIFTSRHPAMISSAVETLKYFVELRSWKGIALQNIHIRDVTFMIEDPGPYIIGLSTECRDTVVPPAEVVVVDLDMNTLNCKSFPPGVTPRHKGEKSRQKLAAALGGDFPSERSVPLEYRVSFPKGSFRNINRVHYGSTRPRYLAERLTPPKWWNQGAIITVFDKIMADKHKKPSLFQRLTRTGLARAQAQLTANEQLAKQMMRKRALHYVEKRDDFELKVARITRRLQKLIQEGEHWKQRFEMFEKYAERLAQESAELKAKIDREQREHKRLSNINTEQSKVNAELQDKLSQTETARAEAMRQLSDMHQSIQELERERNEIMDVIELQITNALQGMPFESDDGHEFNGNGTPPLSPNSTIRHKKARARESTQTIVSLDPAGSIDFTKKPVSVIGALNDGPVRRGLGSIVDGDQVSTADRLMSTKTEGIAHRVASIQAKLEMALAVKEKAEAEAAEAEAEAEAARQAEADAEVARLAEAEAEAEAAAAATPAIVTDNSSDSTAVNEPDETPALRAFVLRPPPRRVMQKRSYESVSTAGRDVRDIRDVHLPAGHAIGTHLHGQGREVDVPEIPDELEPLRPISIASNTTATFGGK